VQSKPVIGLRRDTMFEHMSNAEYQAFKKRQQKRFVAGIIGAGFEHLPASYLKSCREVLKPL
jgi:hypothetical protein